MNLGKIVVLATALLICGAVQAQDSVSGPAAKMEKNKKVVVAMNELFNAGKAGEAMKYYSDSLTKKGNIGGVSFFVAMQQDIETTFPGVKTKIVDLWADGDWVIANCLFQGTHKGIAKLPHHGGLLVDKEPSNK